MRLVSTLSEAYSQEEGEAWTSLGKGSSVSRGQVEPGPKFQAWTLSGGTSDGYLCSHHRVGCR